MRAFNFGGVSSRDFNVGISGTGTYDAPERDITYIDVPGRDGVIAQDNGRFKNISISYPAFISRDFDQWFPKFKAAMMQFKGYQRLTDEYDTEHFREAIYAGQILPQTGTYNKSGKFDVVFNCKPQRFLNSGAVELTILPVSSCTLGKQVQGIEVTEGTEFRLTAMYQSGVTGAANVKYYDEDDTLLQTDAATVSGLALSYTGTVPEDAVSATVEYVAGLDPYIVITNDGVQTCYNGLGGVLPNPTPYDAKPIITLCDSGAASGATLTTFTLGSQTAEQTLTIAATAHSTYDHVTIDSVLQDCYFEGLVSSVYTVANLNSIVTITEGATPVYEFPVIKGGKAMLVYSSVPVKVVPGWWEV